MSKLLIGIGVVVLVLIIGIGGYVMLSSQLSKTGAFATGTQSNIADSSFAGTVYKEWPGTPSPDAVMAIRGFDLSSALQTDGSAIITITNKDTRQVATVNVPKNSSLYIQEKNLGDDSEGADRFTADDSFLVVDQSGNIISTQSAGQ